MKKLVITLFVVLGTAWWLFGQCPPMDTTISTGINVVGLTMDAAPSASLCREDNCQLSVSGQYAIRVTSQSASNTINYGLYMASSQVLIFDSTCQYKLLDTCGTWIAPKAIYLSTSITAGRNFVVVIFPDGSGQDTDAYIDVSPAAAGIYGTHIPCQIPLSTEAAGNTTQVTYKRLDNGLIYTTPLPAGMYVSETLFPAGRKKLILVE